MAQAIADVYKKNMETLRPHIPALLEAETDGLAVEKIKQAEEHRIERTPNSADFRAPIKVQKPANFGTFDRAGGALVAGAGFKIQQLVQTCFPLKLGVDVNLEVRWGSKANKDFKENMSDAISQFKWMQDVSWHNTSGTQGLLGQATAYDTGVFTMDPEFGSNLFQEGMPVEVFASGLGTHRSSSETPSDLPTVSAVDKSGKTVTLTNLGTITPQATDVLAFQGCGSTPAWMLGLYGVNTTTTSGNYLGLSRTTYPTINSNFLDGSSGLTPDMGFIVRSRIRQRRGKVKKLIGFAHDNVLLTIYNQGIAISNWNRGASDKMIDQLPKDSDSVPWCGMTIHRDIHSSKQRIDLVNLDSWFRVYEKKPGYYEDAGGNRFFHGRNSAGTLTANDQFFVVCSQNYGCDDPGAAGFIHSIPINTNM